jgi:thiosulfate/3-mercaptopyruvate sulfurtransferase
MAATSRSLPAIPFHDSSRSAPAVGAVTPAWLESRLTSADLRILDVRKAAETARERHSARRGPPPAYVQGHIPGAVPLDVRSVLFDEAGTIVSAPELAMAMSGLGIGDRHTIVIVDEAVPEAAMAAAWALARYGHAGVHVLEGGFARWVREGRAVSRDIVRHPPASFTARVSS